MIVNGDPLQGMLQDLIRAEQLDGHVWLAGERSDVPSMMRGMNVFLLPSLSEGISNTLLEAMATRLPIIATDVGGSAELVVDGQIGRLVPPADVARLAEAIAELFADPEKAAAMGEAGCERVQAQFSLDAMVRAYLSLYEEQVTAGRNGVQSAAQSRNALR